MGYETLIRRAHVMTRKNTLKSLPTDTEFRVVGLDLAKSDVSVAAIPVDDNTPSLVDRMTYADLLDWAGKISPTLFAMEPCNGYSLLCLQLENLGHEIKVISGWTVSMWINTHLSGQKTDLNDAIALARLAVSDAELTPIRHKSITEIRIQTVQAVRQQLMSQRSKSIVSFKALAQQWGIPCAAGHRNLKKLRESIEAKVDLITRPVANAMLFLLDAVKSLDRQIGQLNQTLQELVMSDERGRLLQSVLGVGTQISARVITVVGNIERFNSPRSLVAYVGVAPRNFITGHKNLTKKKHGNCPDLSHKGQGKISRRGDKLLRSLFIQDAACLYMQFCKDQLPECQLKRWILKQLAMQKPYGKLIVSLAAKLIRIVWAVLTYGEKFNIQKAGMTRSMWSEMALETPLNKEVPA